MNGDERLRFIRIECAVSAVLLVGGIALTRLVDVVGIALWFMGAMGLGHALAIWLGFAKIPDNEREGDDD